MKKLLLAMAMTIVTATVVSAQNRVQPVQSADSALSYDNACGIKFSLNMPGVSKIEIESVDGNQIADNSSIITFNSARPQGLIPGKEYYIQTLPCDLYGGYRFSIYRDGLVAHYFGVHQNINGGEFISPNDLVESELKFDHPKAPLVEKGRPEMDAKTHQLLIQYRRNPTEENRQAILEQMEIRYDKVVARKKNKLRELEREAKTRGVIDKMREIVNEMVENRDMRIQQQFRRFIDPRRNERNDGEWMVLRGNSDRSALIGYAPVTNAAYARFKEGFVYDSNTANYPVVNITIEDVNDYCRWLTDNDNTHIYRLPTEEEWVLGAGHMPKDVEMNANRVHSGLTPVDAYKDSPGACGGIDFWGNCWEWTSTTKDGNQYIVKGGAWDSKRDDCRSEKSNDTRDGTKGFANVGFRIIRVDK